MKRWLFLLLLIPSNGCMMIEDMLFADNASPGYYQTAAQQPASSCNAPITNVAASQTAEPELLRR